MIFSTRRAGSRRDVTEVFVKNNYNFPPGPSNDGGHPRSDIDGSLPRAHTCFFQIDLPAYSSVEIARDRILFAIRNCVTVSMA